MESTAISDPGFYWHFAVPTGRVPPQLVELVSLDGKLVVLAPGCPPQALAGMAGDFAGPLPADVPPVSGFTPLETS
jgi:hypothetical protein